MNNRLQIGALFTPLSWAQFAIERFGIFDQWLRGASIFDPTMGKGSLLEALILFGLKRGFAIEQLPTHLLYGNELNRRFYKKALKKFNADYKLDISHHLWNEDILALPARSFDILFGNPPWQNFVDLPYEYRGEIKKEFLRYDLVQNSRDLLLGGSRIDIAALIIQKSIKEFLRKNGQAYFFLPLSLFLGGGASQYFRKYRIHNVEYSVKEIYDFRDSRIFSNVATRYGLASFKRDERQRFPIRFERLERAEAKTERAIEIEGRGEGTGRGWIRYMARPLLHRTDALSIARREEELPLSGFTPIAIGKESLPRQGVNSCGANSIFFFDSYQELDSAACLVSNLISRAELPKRYIYPLLTAANFRQDELTPLKWALLPYARNGRPIEKEELMNEKSLYDYLLQWEQLLSHRKGSLIGSWLKRGYWWSLLGVGAYSFFPYKIAWESYGKATFKPMIVRGEWQANQSLQAFIPLKTLGAARQILVKLQNPAIESYLLSLKMEGTMNWAQPGRIRPLLKLLEQDSAKRLSPVSITSIMEAGP